MHLLKLFFICIQINFFLNFFFFILKKKMFSNIKKKINLLPINIRNNKWRNKKNYYQNLILKKKKIKIFFFLEFLNLKRKKELNKFSNLKKKIFKYVKNSRFILKSFLFLKKKTTSTNVKIKFFEKVFKELNFKIFLMSLIFILLKNKIVLNLNDAIFFLKKKNNYFQRSMATKNVKFNNLEMIISNKMYLYLKKVRKKILSCKLKFKKKKKKNFNKKNLRYFFFFFVFNYFENKSFFSFFSFDYPSLSIFIFIWKNYNYVFNKTFFLLHNYFSNLYLWKKK